MTGAAPSGSPFGRAAATAVAGELVGRRREVELLVAALGAGARVLLEGPPGTGKSTPPRALASAPGVVYVPVEGNASSRPPGWWGTSTRRR